MQNCRGHFFQILWLFFSIKYRNRLVPYSMFWFLQAEKVCCFVKDQQIVCCFRWFPVKEGIQTVESDEVWKLLYKHVQSNYGSFKQAFLQFDIVSCLCTSESTTFVSDFTQFNKCLLQHTSFHHVLRLLKRLCL